MVYSNHRNSFISLGTVSGRIKVTHFWSMRCEIRSAGATSGKQFQENSEELCERKEPRPASRWVDSCCSEALEREALGQMQSCWGRQSQSSRGVKSLIIVLRLHSFTHPRTALPRPGIEPRSPALQAGSSRSELPGKPNEIIPFPYCLLLFRWGFLSVAIESNLTDTGTREIFLNE